METLKNLEEKGGVVRVGVIWKVTMPDGTVWVEKPSENGNGWYLGDSSNSDNLLFEKV